AVSTGAVIIARMVVNAVRQTPATAPGAGRLRQFPTEQREGTTKVPATQAGVEQGGAGLIFRGHWRWGAPRQAGLLLERPHSEAFHDPQGCNRPRRTVADEPRWRATTPSSGPDPSGAGQDRTCESSGGQA